MWNVKYDPSLGNGCSWCSGWFRCDWWLLFKNLKTKKNKINGTTKNPNKNNSYPDEGTCLAVDTAGKYVDVVNDESKEQSKHILGEIVDWLCGFVLRFEILVVIFRSVADEFAVMVAGELIFIPLSKSSLMSLYCLNVELKFVVVVFCRAIGITVVVTE